MRRLRFGISAVVIGAAVLTLGVYLLHTRAGGQNQAGEGASPVTYVEWPLPEADKAYGAIDGHHVWQYVVEQAMIARRYRDNGHPQFWGRITGTSSDTEDMQWMMNKFKQFGMTDVHVQPIDMPPQWVANSWSVSVTSGEKTLPLSSAEVAYRTPATHGDGLDVEAVDVGFGSEADFKGHDVHGKVVLVFAMPKPGRSSAQSGALKRAEQMGAAAIITVEGLPGNMKFQSYDLYTHVPTFSLGAADGKALRDLIGQAGTGNPPHVKIRVDAGNDPALTKTGLVFGSLPGMTDETIYVIAHRDGWFDASGDNGGGVADMLGLAEYFSKVPKSQRRRTLVFIGTDGHHQIKPGGYGREWLLAHRAEFFTKTAMMINCEHPSDVATYGTDGGAADTTIPLQWYAGGPSRPKMTEMVANIFREFGVTTWAQPSPIPPGGDLNRFWWFLPGLDAQSNDFLYFHTDANTPETVPWTGLEATTRAYAKIIDEVNKIDLKDLQRPPEADPNAPGTPNGYL